jgi:hypothetical protein
MAKEYSFEDVARLIDKVGHGILGSEAFADDGWMAISLVTRIEGAIFNHGFKYYPDGRVIPASEITFETTMLFVELVDTMEQLEGRRWKVCLVQIVRPDMKIHIEYEYDDGDRWSVTPANLETMREELRPAV